MKKAKIEPFEKHWGRKIDDLEESE